MANENTILTRLALKIDTYANWTLDNATTQTNKTHANLVLMRGEIGLCEIPEPPNTGSTEATTAPTVLFKVGDGTSPFKNLKWASAKASDVYAWAKSENFPYEEVAANPLHTGAIKVITKLEWKNTTKYPNGALVGTYDYAASIEEVKAITGDLTDLSDRFSETGKQNLVAAINETLQAVEVGGTGSVVTVRKQDDNTYVVQQGGKDVDVPIAIGDGTLTMKVGNDGLVATETTFGANDTTSPTFTVSHAQKPTTGSKETNTTAETAATTFVTGVKVDTYGHIAGVTTAEVVIPEVPGITYTDDTTATVPETDTVEVIGNISVNASNNHNLIEDTVQVATAESFTYRNTEKPINTVGGIGTSTDMSEITFKEFVTKLLYPYTKPTISASRTPSTTSALEKGDDKTITKVAVTVTKKSEPITSVALYNGSTLLEEKTSGVASGGTFNFTVSVPVNSTNVVLTAKATDAAGTTVSANTTNWSFVYPYYYGVCTVEEYPNITGADLRDSTKFTKDIAAKGNKSYSYTTNNQCMVIAFPKGHGVLKSAKDPSGFQNIDEFTPNRREINITGLDGTSQAYYVYRNNPSTNTGFTVAFTH